MTAHPIPLEVLDDHFAVLAKTGKGKTYMAKGLVERLLEKKRRVCIVDPKNAWWGLKSSADGKSEAFPIIIFGGPNGDMPLLPEHGKVLGEAVATTHMPCIICTKGMTEQARIRFLTDFFQTLDMKNAEPLHLVLDEAHMMAPQKPLGEMQRLTHYTSELVSGGRGMGFRIILLSQRPARLNKDVLTQCESLVAMGMTGPQDRDAVRAWIHDQADVDVGKEIVASLPGLQKGEGWFWSPARDILKRVKFPEIHTYDNSKTKKDSAADAKAKLAPVDLSALQGKLSKVKAEIDAHDPKALKARIAELEKQLRAKTPSPKVETNTVADQASAARMRVAGYNEGIKTASSAWKTAVIKFRGEIEEKVKAICKASFVPPTLHEQAGGVAVSVTPPLHTMKPMTQVAVRAAVNAAVKRVHREDAGVSPSQQKMLNALMWWKQLGRGAPTKEMVGVVAGYSPASGHIGNLLSELATAGFVIRNAGAATLTLEGEACAEMPAGDDSILERVRSILSTSQRKMFDAVVSHYPDAIDNKVAGVEAGFNETSGHIGNLLSELSTMSLIERSKGESKAVSWLFGD